MKQVLRLAEKGRGRTSPNPMVGAIIVKGGKAIGKRLPCAGRGTRMQKSWPFGKLGKRQKGRSLHQSRAVHPFREDTPPCAPRVIERTVKRVVIGMKDPNPRVKGRGILNLRQAGIEVEVGIWRRIAGGLNEAFCKCIAKKEPFVVLKVASTLDGKIATRRGDSKWITGEVARRFVHRLRDQVDGVLGWDWNDLKRRPQAHGPNQRGARPIPNRSGQSFKNPGESEGFEGSPSRVIIATTREGSNEKTGGLRGRGPGPGLGFKGAKGGFKGLSEAIGISRNHDPSGRRRKQGQWFFSR